MVAKQEDISLILVDDHQIVIDGLKALLEGVKGIMVLGEANSGEELLKTLTFLSPNLIILDVNMPGMDGVETCRKVRQQFPEIQVMALTMHNDRGVIQAMTQAGAKGYVLKNTSREELVEAIRKVNQGKRYIIEEATERLLEPEPSTVVSEEVIPAVLTSREREILSLIAEGYSNTEIGDQLNISHRTVDTHRTNLMKKIGVRNIAGLIRYAFRHGIVT